MNRKKVPHLVLLYERDIDIPNNKLLKKLHSSFCALTIPSDYLKWTLKDGLNKQDLELSYSKKVSNWVEFTESLGAEGLSKLYSYVI